MPPVRGRVTENAPLAQLTWLGVGGPAEVLFEPADKDDLAFFLKAKVNTPVTVIGGGSNLLIRDGGIPGVVIRLTSGFKKICVDGDKIICDAAVKNTEIAQAALEAGLSGFEFMVGIPGTIGGAVRMNAGAHGGCVADRLVELNGLEQSGAEIRLTRDEIPFDYRENALPSGWIFTDVVLKGVPDTQESIAARMTEFKKLRKQSQPTGVRTAGSMFKNPVGLKAWQLIEKAGCRGLRVGNAIVSEKHANFFVNLGGATARDFETLAEEVQKRVWETSEINLEWEVRRVGVKPKAFSTFGGK